MANYTVDIAVAIKNAEKLRAFDRSIKALSDNIENANFFIKTFSKENDGLVKSVGNLQQNLSAAGKNLKNVALGTKEATIAAAGFLKAQNELNEGLAEQQKLLDDISGKTAQKAAADNKKLQAGLLKLERQSTRELEEQFQLRQTGQEQLKQKVSEINQQRREENKLLKENVIKTKQSVAAEIKKRFSIIASAKQRRRDLIISNRQVQTEIKINNILAARRRTQSASGGRAGGKGNLASSAIIGGSFPLLFGQTGAAAIGGGIGGAAGGALGGQFGFALSILGTAIGTAVDKAEKFNKSLVELNQRMGITGTTTAITSKEVNSLAKSLNVTKQEVFGVLGAFQEFGSGEIAKSMAMIFGGDAGGVDRFAGLDRSAKLAQEIFNARKQIGNEAAKDLLVQNQSVETAVIELALVKAKAKAEQDAAIARVKAVSAFDQFRSNTPGLLIRRWMGTMKMTDYGDIRAENLRKKFEEDNITLLENYKKGIIEARELLDLLRESQGQFGASGTLQFTAVADRIKDLQDGLTKLYNPIYRILTLSQTLESSFKDAFKGIITGTMSVQDAFRNMFMRIADSYAEMVADMLAKQVSIGLLKFIGNAFLGGLANSADIWEGKNLDDGMTYWDTDMDVGARASGGPVSGGKPYIVGEEGPEIFTPGVSGGITPNHALGGSTNISVNIDASGTSVQGSESNGEELGRLVAAAIQSELIKEKRPGGLLS